MILFVTGTDTGVGKTIASAWIAAEARAAGKHVRYVKPLQTGLAPDEHGSDADIVARMAGVEVHELLRFAAPLAPSVAARLERKTIDVERLRDDVRALDCDLLVVEGAGGLLVPVTDAVTMAGFAAMLGGSIAIVARPVLGTLNHTALTIEAARACNLVIDSILVSDWPAEPGLTETTNLDELARHGLPVRTVPHLDADAPLDAQAVGTR